MNIFENEIFLDIIFSNLKITTYLVGTYVCVLCVYKWTDLQEKKKILGII